MGMKNQLSTLSERHKLIALMDLQGISQRNISKEVGLSEVWIGRIRQSDAYRKYLAGLRLQHEAAVIEDEVAAIRQLKEDMAASIRVLRDVMESGERDSDRISAAKAILDHTRKATGLEKSNLTISTKNMEGLGTEELVKLIDERMSA